MPDKLLGKARFLELLCTEFGYAAGGVSMETRLIADLGFDSLQWLRLAVFVEMLVPFDAPDDTNPDELTVGDIYALYCKEYARLMLDESV